MEEIGEISTIASGADAIIEWRIPDFFLLPKDDGAGFPSTNFSFGGEEWFLMVYPNGSSAFKSSEHVILVLWKDSSSPCIRQAFSLSLKNLKGEKELEEHCTEEFDEVDYAQKPFISRSELWRKQAKLVPEGVLTVVCTMKNKTSAGSAKRKGRKKKSDNSYVDVFTQTEENDGIATAECSYCQKYLSVRNISMHEKKCMNQPVKCPDCSTVVHLRDWYDHDCQSSSLQKCEVGTSEFYINNHEKKVVHDLKELFFQKEDCDVVIKVKDSELSAHRLILKARSPVFASTFRHNMKEKITGIVKIEDCDPAPFSDFLFFLYCGEVGMISQENVFSLFTLADKYEVLDLKAKCLDFMKNNLAINAFCETLTLALQHSETDLISLATDFFVKNAEEILPTVKWQTFAAENPTQSNELVIKLVKWFKHSNA